MQNDLNLGGTRNISEQIDKDSFVPPYYQLAQILERKIKSGELGPDEPLPSESELGEKYGLSRMTVRKGVAKLIEAGLVYTMQGKGTFVSRRRLDRAMFRIDEFHEDMKQRGWESDARLLEAKVIPAPADVARKLALQPDARVLSIRRLLFANGEPLVYDRKYLLYDKGKPILEAELEYEPLPELVEKHSDVLPASSKLTVQATVVKEDEAELLRVAAGTPAFCVEQVLYSADGRPVGLGYLIYRGDRYRLTSLPQPF